MFFSELQKYDRVVRFLQEQHEERRSNSIQFVKSGVEHGYFRSDLNYGIVAKMSDAVLNHVMMTKMYEEYPMSEIFKHHINIVFNGICTEKGLAELRLLQSL